MVELFANSGDPDQTPRSAASDLGLHCLPVTLLGLSSLQWVNLYHHMNTFQQMTSWHFSLFFSFFFSENRLQHFMQIVSLGHNLYEMSEPICWKDKKKKIRMSSAELFTQQAKRLELKCNHMFFFVFFLFCRQCSFQNRLSLKRWWKDFIQCHFFMLKALLMHGNKLFSKTFRD